MTISRFLTWVMMVPIGIWAVWIAVSEPLGRPYGQPAAHEPSPKEVLALTGGYQAQGDLR